MQYDCSMKLIVLYYSRSVKMAFKCLINICYELILEGFTVRFSLKALLNFVCSQVVYSSENIANVPFFSDNWYSVFFSILELVYEYLYTVYRTVRGSGNYFSSEMKLTIWVVSNY